jgi:hypothetical protein
MPFLDKRKTLKFEDVRKKLVFSTISTPYMTLLTSYLILLFLP